MYQQIFQLHADALKAMAHPKRLEIIHLLRDQQLCVTDIIEMLGLPQANLSQHLQILRDAHLVTTRKEGKHIYYQLAHANIVTACDAIRQMLIEQNSDSGLSEQLRLSMQELMPLSHDPVCGMRVSPKTASAALQYEHHTYYFCATGCYEKFIKEPHHYAQQDQ
jgi:DNA-binding transcriptional ArsR family regulator